MFLLMIMLISDQSLLSAYMYLPTLRVARKGAVSRNSAKLGNYKMHVTLRET